MMSNNPFNNYIDDDRTILRPTPGGGRSSQFTSQPASLEHRSINNAGERLESIFTHTDFQNNALVSAASTLLALISQLRHTASHSDVNGLRNQIMDEIKRFEEAALKNNVSRDKTHAARYALCTFLDETVLNTPWGYTSIWGTQSLLVTFHQETFGGEKFFVILQNCTQQPGTHLDLLELLYFCLCLGFQGRYRGKSNGQSKLDEIREHTYQVLQRQRGDYEKTLSPSWQGIKNKHNQLRHLIPIWVIATVASMLLTAIFLGFLYRINIASSPIIAQLYQLKDSLNITPVTMTVPAPVPSPITPSPSRFAKLRTFLQPEVERGEVAILEQNGKTIIRILINGFFASASDRVMPSHYDLLQKIAVAVSDVSGHILIVGHTDNSPIFTARFPSNWDLSKARAAAVEKLLTENQAQKATLTIEGRGDSQPIVENDTKEHKAMNRRVEIIL